MKNLSVLLFVLVLLGSCGIKELETENAELKTKISDLEKGNLALYEIGVLLDSIDATRNNLYVDLEEGTTYEEYVKRVEGLSDYVKTAEQRIMELQDDVSKMTKSNRYFEATIKRMQAELDKKNDQIKVLLQEVDEYKIESASLVKLVEMQETELEDKDLEILRKTEELELIEARIEELMIQAQMSEADSYYARAEAIEEAANRTKLAPRKKKETYLEALELYQKALDAGKTEAQEKIDLLKEKVD